MFLSSLALSVMVIFLGPLVSGALLGLDHLEPQDAPAPRVQLAARYNRIPSNNVRAHRFHARRSEMSGQPSNDIQYPQAAAHKKDEPVEKRSDKCGSGSGCGSFDFGRTTRPGEYDPPGLVKNVTEALIVVNREK